MLRREMAKIDTGVGEICVKNGYLKGKKIKSKPEYEDCRRLAKEKGLTLQDIYDRAQSRERLKR
jgi:uncharacterized protein (DUF111 family)